MLAALQLSIRTLNRAKAGLGIITTREGFGPGSEGLLVATKAEFRARKLFHGYMWDRAG